MANQWFRMYTEFSHDPKVQSMSEAMQRRLVMLFCLRCSNVAATLQEQELAFALRIDEAELTETKELFLRKGFIDEQWCVLNWDKRQFISDSSTDRSRKHREAKKVAATLKQQGRNVAATAPDTDTDTETDKEITPLTPLTPLPVAAKAKRKPRCKLPDGFVPDATGSRKAADAGLDAAAELEKFRDHHVGKGTLAADWQATWRTWVSKAVEFGRGGKVHAAEPSCPQWFLDAGFTSMWDAQNARCTERNANQFRGGKRIEVAA